MKIDPKNPAHWLLLLQQGVYTLCAIVVRVFRGKPQKQIVILYGHQFSGNLKALYREWERGHSQDFDLYFLCLDTRHAAALRASNVRVLQCNRLSDMLVLSQASALISDHFLHLMSPLLSFSDIYFIDVWHGIPFKGFIPRDFTLLHRYDEVWVSSPLLKSLYVEKFGFNPEKVVSIGYARTDILFSRPDDGSAFKLAAAIPAGNKVVLFAPTWQQDDAGRDLIPFGESQQAFIDLMANACRDNAATLVVRAHLNAHLDHSNRADIVFCSQRDFPDTESILLATDVLICDWSSIAFDFLAMGKPTIFLDVPPPFKHGFSLDEEFRFGEVVADGEALDTSLRRCLGAPAEYLQQYGDKHDAVIEQVYANATEGKVATRQLQRLLEILQAG